MKFSIAGTIPTGQYANIQPTFEIEADSNDEALREGLRLMQAAYQAVGKSLDLETVPAPQKPLGELLTCWASGTRVYFDPVTHTYSSPDGARGWLSGSAFAKKYVSEFPSELISKKVAAKALRENDAEVSPESIREMWAKKGEVSSSFGTSLHAALELYEKYGPVSLAVKGSTESVEVANPYLAGAVRAFFDGREHETAACEVFVADPVRKHCGQIDRLVIHSDGSVDIEDYKSNAELTEKKETILPPFKESVPANKVGQYTMQLNFYRAILEGHGVVVRAMRIHHWDGEGWIEVPVDRVDVSIAF